MGSTGGPQILVADLALGLDLLEADRADVGSGLFVPDIATDLRGAPD